MLEEDYSLGLAASRRRLGGYLEAPQWGKSRLGASQGLQLQQRTEHPRQGGLNRLM